MQTFRRVPEISGTVPDEMFHVNVVTNTFGPGLSQTILEHILGFIGIIPVLSVHTRAPPVVGLFVLNV